MPQTRAMVQWRTLTIVLAILLAMSVITVIMAVTLALNYRGLPKDVADRIGTLTLPTATVTATVPAEPVPLADQVAVAWSVATGWPNSEKWGYISGYESLGDDLVVHTNEAAATDLSEMCTKLYELNDDVIGLDPHIDQILATGVDGQVVWSCSSTSEVQ